MIISFSKLGRHGRLGNQLFQVMATMGMAERYGAEARFPAWGYEQYFEVPGVRFEGSGDRVRGVRHQVMEKQFQYYEWEIEGDSDLVGYLQSERYFGSTRLRFKEAFLEAMRAGHAGLFEKETICVHIRRGDYVGNEAYHQLTVHWFIDAMLTHFPRWRECNILFLSDEIEYCRTHFECLPNAWFGGGGEIEDMALGSLCDNFIISNSSFGWWTAWLGEGLDTAGTPTRPPKKVVCSGRLHAGSLMDKDWSDYYPERWIRHQREKYKIDLGDVTFTIPVLRDSQDRKDNLELCICLLQMAFETNIIVSEQGGRKFEYVGQWVKYMPFEGNNFHRTKMLNEMALAADTAYVANWDCDVIIPPMQVYMAVEALRGGAEMVFPYDGRFGRMPREPWFKRIQRRLDIGVVGKEKFKNRVPGHNSVGGAVMFNREAFIEGGMENEHMISFGPEDAERHDRFKALGYDIRRVGGSLFHVDHYVGQNSSPANPFFRANHRELDKIRGLLATPEALRAYVDTWGWCSQYTSRYYHEINEGAMRSAKAVMGVINGKWKVESRKKKEERGTLAALSVIDVGGGLGEWNDGNELYWCVDYRVKPEELLIGADHYIDCNLEKEFPDLGRRFDLCLCLEVAEHLRPERAEGLVGYLCSLADRVLFSAAIPFQGGVGHVNEQWQSWWAELFIKQGFGAAKRQPEIRENEEVELWYRQNIVLYERGGGGRVVDFVLPEYYIEIVKGKS